MQKGRFTVSNATEDSDTPLNRDSLMNPLDIHSLRRASNAEIPTFPDFRRPQTEEDSHSPMETLELPLDQRPTQRSGFTLRPDRYLDNVPMYAASTSALPEPSIGSLTLQTSVPVISPVPPKTESPQRSEGDEKKVPIGLITQLQEHLSAQFTEMMNLHKSVMVDMMARDTRRDAQLKDLMDGHLELVKATARLQIEHMRLRERLYSRD